MFDNHAQLVKCQSNQRSEDLAFNFCLSPQISSLKGFKFASKGQICASFWLEVLDKRPFKHLATDLSSYNRLPSCHVEERAMYDACQK